MHLADILPAVQVLAANPVVTELRAHTYLSTYPVFIAMGAAPGVAVDQRFYQLASMVYAWMPRVLRIDPVFTTEAIAAFGAAQTATAENFEHIQIQSIADCLHSVVGASKLLHFVNPSVFPIWDSNIEGFRGAGSNIGSVPDYLDYVREVNDIRGEAGFAAFFEDFLAAYQARLIGSGVPPYFIKDVRAVESAAFELSR